MTKKEPEPRKDEARLESTNCLRNPNDPEKRGACAGWDRGGEGARSRDIGPRSNIACARKSFVTCGNGKAVIVGWDSYGWSGIKRVELTVALLCGICLFVHRTQTMYDSGEKMSPGRDCTHFKSLQVAFFV